MAEKPPAAPACGLLPDPEAHIEPFLETLAALGYRPKTLDGKRRNLEEFLQWLRDCGRVLRDVEESCVARYLRRVRKKFDRRELGKRRATLRQFLEHLRSIGLIAPVPRPACSPAGALVERYVKYLRDRRGLSKHSIAVYVPFIRAFVTSLSLADPDILDGSLGADLIRKYVLNRAQGRSCEFTRLLATSLRSFLRFLFQQGETAVDLSIAVPPVRRWQLAAAPAFLSPADVERVLAAVNPSTARGRRALAMLLLLARLGLRPGEVARLQLDDIDWVVGEIVVPGKGNSRDRLPLPQDVGEALALYLRHVRGNRPSHQLFLRMLAPYVGLSGPCAVCAVARGAIRRAGLSPRGRFGAHIFRHSLATRMIRHGATLEEISQVLRHRSVTTTQIYAKVDFEDLRAVALPWPARTGGGR